MELLDSVVDDEVNLRPSAGLDVLYDLAFKTQTALQLNIQFTKHQSFQPKIDEYNNGKEFKFELLGYWYEVRVTESVPEPSLSSFEAHGKHSMVNIKVDDKKKFSAKIQQYLGASYWNVIDIHFLRPPLKWYRPLLMLDAKRILIEHERDELKLQRKRMQIEEKRKQDLWDD